MIFDQILTKSAQILTIYVKNHQIPIEKNQECHFLKIENPTSKIIQGIYIYIYIYIYISNIILLPPTPPYTPPHPPQPHVLGRGGRGGGVGHVGLGGWGGV